VVKAQLTLLSLLVALAATGCTWIDPTELICTEYGHASCPDGYHCGTELDNQDRRHCVEGDPPPGDDDDDSAGDDDDSAGDDDDSAGDDDDSPSPDSHYRWRSAAVSGLNSDASLQAVSFPTDRNGWAVGRGGVILRSIDFGKSWVLQATPSQADWFDVFFLDEQNGWIVGGPNHEGTVLFTHNGGIDWQQVQEAVGSTALSGVYANANAEVWVVGGTGTSSSVDGGQSWSAMPGSSFTYRAVAGYHGLASSVWAVGLGGLAHRLASSSEGPGVPGLVTQQDLRDVHVLNATQLWAVGRAGTLLTTDPSDGSTWEDRSIPGLQDYALSGVDFSNSGDHGAIVGEVGTVLYSTDGGEVWHQAHQPPSDEFRLDGVHVRGNRTWAVGERGTILWAILDETCTAGNLIDDDDDGWTECDGDCNDGDGDIHPGQDDTACATDGEPIDRNCNGIYGEDAPEGQAFYLDVDADSFGSGDFTLRACEMPEGYSLESNDCDDENALVAPGHEELCDGIDNDCDGVTPEEEVDNDGDGFPLCDGLDCDDTEPQVYLGAAELCDGLDNDCDGSDNFAGHPEEDIDGDGVLGCNGDCEDTEPDVFPGNPELCDGLDNDCNGLADFDSQGEADVDGDGVRTCQDDCDDTNPSIYPGATETCDDGIDQDCDGSDLVCTGTDADGDGFASGNDCNDTDSGTNPGAAEIIGNDIDEDCSGNALCFEDNDLDGFGSTVPTALAATAGLTTPLSCDDPTNRRANDSTDCNDQYAFYNPADVDGDGYSTCDSPPDCDDYDLDRHPGVWDINESVVGGALVDQDCDGDGLTTGAAVSAIGFTSECSFTNHDFVVGPAGDFTGNGVNDLVFGDPGWSAQLCTLATEGDDVGGRSYLWRPRAAGGAGDNLPLIGQSTQLGDTGADGAYLTGGIDMYSGYSVALGGDINNDGLSDMLIGAPQGRVGSNPAGGVVYLVLGRTSGPSAALTAEGPRTISPFLSYAHGADFTFYSDELGDKTGETIAWAGDIDNDTYDEILIGAPGYYGNRGRVYLLDGAAITGAMDGSAAAISCTDGSNPVANCMHLPAGIPSNTTFTGAADERLGRAIAAGMDLSGDSRPDLALGSPSGVGSGVVYVFLSEELLDSNAGLVTLGDAWNTGIGSVNLISNVPDLGTGINPDFGATVVMVPDMANDTVSPGGSGPETAELLIGQPASGAGYPKAAVVYGQTITSLWSGGGSILNQSNWDLNFLGDGSAGMGTALAAGDVDGDNYGDILICEPQDTNGGRGYLYTTSSLMTGTSPFSASDALVIFRGESPGDRFCASATFPGNVDGTAHGDLLIAAPGRNNGIGKAYLFLSN